MSPARRADVRQDPAQRMAAILVAEDALGFDEAWAAGWRAMCRERAWPHAMRYRKAWKGALNDCRDQCSEALESGGPLDGWVMACRDRKDALLEVVARATD